MGPRPALPDEVATFDDAHLARLDVRPGITGLWQVEARDNPSFSSYGRLDIFYVDNWSLGLDRVILLATLEGAVLRIVQAVLPQRRNGDALATAVLD